MRVLFVIPSGDYLPSGIVRVAQFYPFLDREGIRHQTLSYYSATLDRRAASVRGSGSSVLMRRLMLMVIGAAQVACKWWTRVRMVWATPRVDVVFLQGILPPVWQIALMRAMNPRIVLDMDDAIFLGNPARGAAVVQRVSMVIAGSHFIFDYAKAHNANVVLVPSAVSLDRYDRAAVVASSLSPTPVRVGWLGSTSTIKYLSQLVGPLTTLAAEGHAIELCVDGIGNHHAAVPAFPGVTVRCTSTYRDEDIPAIVSGYDVGVMPLDDGPWERAKCAMKALIYMAARKPVVCSRVGENRFVIEDEVNGLLADSEAEWTTALRSVIGDSQRRAVLGARGRETVEARYASTVCFALLRRHVFAPTVAPTELSGMAS
jgi:glycosyltransferase involved in cell wall biosynthesis